MLNSWCGPCKILKPRLEKVIEAKGGKVHLAKVNVDDHGELAMEYGVSLFMMKRHLEIFIILRFTVISLVR